MITIIHGSHRKGNHWNIAKQLEEQLKKNQNDVRLLDLSEASFQECCGCQVCQEGECVHKDDALYSFLKSSILPADVIYIVTPTYFNMPPSKLKSFIDRTNAFLPALSSNKKTTFFGSWVSGEADMDSISMHSNLLKCYATIMGWVPIDDICVCTLKTEASGFDRNHLFEIAESIERLVNA